MFVARKHSAFEGATAEGRWTCKSCGWSGTAVAIGVGEGAGASPFLLDEAGAKQRARSQAQEAALRDAGLALAIAPCPQCDVRDPAAVKAFKRKAALMTAGLFALGLAVGVMIGALTHPTYGLCVGLLAAGAGIWVENQKRSGTWDRSTTDVDFTRDA
jgi:hypothetical protein